MSLQLSVWQRGIAATDEEQLRVERSVLRELQERMFNFEKLDVWQEAIVFADLVYDLTAAFPNDERFGLTSQMRRAAISISSNLAEGSSRASRIDFGRFVEIAAGSLFEVMSQATIALRRKMIGQDEYNQIYALAEKQSKMLSGLRKSLSEA